MLEALLAPLAQFATWIISTLGYPGIMLAMAIESASIPLPSEIIMPFSGFLVSQGHFTFLGIVLAGTLGGVLGSLLAYAVGYRGGETVVRQLIKKYGRYVLIYEYELDEATDWFDRHGSLVTFLSRLLPVVRTFISLPAGIAKMNLKAFLFYAFAGSLLWTCLLAYLGLILGNNWDTLGTYFHRFDLLLFLLGVATLAWYIRHKLQKIKKYSNRKSAH